MILSTLNDSKRIERLHPLFKTFFDYVKNNNLLNAPLGRIDVDGDKLFINNVDATLVEAEKQPLEAHRKYIDIHVVLEGEELIGWKALEEIKETRQEYDESSDCALYDDKPTTWAKLHGGQFLIVYPEDPHAPVVGKGRVRKLIGKVLVE